MERSTQENIFIGILLCLFVGYVLMSLDFGPNARLVPLPISIIGLMLLVTQLAQQNLLKTVKLKTSAEKMGPKEPETDGKREIIALGFITGFVALIILLGPLAAVFFFSVMFFIVTKHYALWKAIAVALILSATMYFLFIIGLRLESYHGILGSLLVQSLTP